MRTGKDNGAEALLTGMNAAAAQVIVFAPTVAAKKAVFNLFCKCAKWGTQRISRARGLSLRAGAQPLAPFRREGHSGDLYPRRAGYADVYGPGCRA